MAAVTHLSIVELYVDSRDSRLYSASADSNPARIRVNLPHVFGSRKFNEVILREACVPNLIKPCNSTNNTLTFQENNVAVDIPIVIPEGFYDGLTMATALQSQMNTAGSNTYAVSYNSTLKSLSIQMTVGTNFLISSESDLLGFLPVSSFGTIYNGPQPVRLDGLLDYVSLEMSGHSFDNYSTSGRYDILSKIHLTSGYGDVVYYTDESNNFLKMKSSELNYIDLTLLDPKGNTVILPSNAHCSYTLLFK